MKYLVTILIGAIVVLAVYQVYKKTRGLSRPEMIDYLNSLGVGVGTWPKLTDDELATSYAVIKQAINHVQPSRESVAKFDAIRMKYSELRNLLQ